MDNDDGRLTGFTLTLGITEVFGALSVVLVIIWTSHYHGGFSWRSNPSVEFNWHPVLMTIGFIFLYGNSILVYRAVRDAKKKHLKMAHMCIHVTAFVLAVIALQAVFDSHNLADPKPIPNLYSLHSWIGLTAIILFSCQWVAGFVAFMFPGLHIMLRTAYLPVHVFFGLSGFVLAILAAVVGISEKANWAINNIQDLPSEGILVNILGLSLIIYGGLVIYLISENRFRRQPRSEDEMLLNSTYE